jgi:hypothetical protein
VQAGGLLDVLRRVLGLRLGRILARLLRRAIMIMIPLLGGSLSS